MPRLVRPLSRRGLISGSAALALAGLLPGRKALAAAERHLIVVWNKGGWDTSTVYDPHFESSDIDRDPTSEPATHGGIDHASSVGRPSVDAFFQAHGDRCCVVNGISIGSISHPGCTRLALTGYKGITATDLPGIVAKTIGGSAAIPHAVLTGPRYPGQHGDVVVPVNALFSDTVGGRAPSPEAWDTDAETLIQQYLADEAAAMASGPRLDAWSTGLSRLPELAERAEQIAVADEPLVPDLVQLAVDLVDLGLSRCVMFDAGLPLQTQWDSHNANHLMQDRAHENAFDVLGQLVRKLSDQGLLDRTTVLFLSEMGRSPKLNFGDGKDHWPYTSALVVGGGIAGGQILGATNGRLEGQPIDLATGQASASGRVLSSASFLAGVLQSFGVDPAPWFPDDPPLTAILG